MDELLDTLDRTTADKLATIDDERLAKLAALAYRLAEMARITLAKRRARREQVLPSC